MTRRAYRQGRRGDAAAETRRRIVAATQALHAERGIAATSMKDIAQRAGVSVGTVYHHFPSYDDAIEACGRHTLATLPPPGPEIFDGLEELEARVHRLAGALFGFLDRLPALERVRCDQHLFPKLRAFVEMEAAQRLSLVRAALEPARPDEAAIQLAAAVLDVTVLRALQRTGLDTQAAASQLARLILNHLAAKAP
ncbi:MAG: TetR/AcrR family transcriptional regulator [Alphaproteobacteria bacterium]|nr:TetR/AcrR family transcriptional regulator [Alphaproteobacteria bacterium]